MLLSVVCLANTLSFGDSYKRGVNSSPHYVYVYESALNPSFQHPIDWLEYTDEYIEKLKENKRETYVVLDDPEGRFRVIVAGTAIPLFGLKDAGSIFRDGAKTGQIGFDTTTPLGQRALALIRNYNPYVDESEPEKQPLLNVGLDVFWKPEGKAIWGSESLEGPELGYYKYPGNENILERRKADKLPEPKGPGYFIATPIIRPYAIRRFWKKGEYNVFLDGEYAKLAHDLVMSEYESALDEYRIGIDSYAASLINLHFGGVGNKVPGLIDLRELPDDASKRLINNIMTDPKTFGFLNQEDASQFIERGGKLEVKYALSISLYTKNPLNKGALNGVSVQLPIIDKKKKN